MNEKKNEKEYTIWKKKNGIQSMPIYKHFPMLFGTV